MMATKLQKILIRVKNPVIAVSGGVDSMTLSSFSHEILGYDNVRMVHAISPAVPVAATLRTRIFAKKEGWNIEYIDAGEFSDSQYLANPVNRCYFCKSNLYSSLSKLNRGVILSGTNTDDLSDFRPGLKAAKEKSVRHPYVEAGFSKSNLRDLAHALGLTSLASLPSSPCLASRVETGIRIRPGDLKSIDCFEDWIQKNFNPRIIRCRLRSKGISIELDEGSLVGLSTEQRQLIEKEAHMKFPQIDILGVRIEKYKKGSSFLGVEGLKLDD